MSHMFQQMLVTVDGFIAGPNGEFDWHVVDADFSEYIDQMLRSLEGIVMGRHTYDGLSQYWPTATEPEAFLMNGLPKYVVSNSLTEATWSNTTIISGDAATAVADLKASSNGTLGLFASATLGATLTQAELIDEYRIIVCPILLGDGIRLHPGLPSRVPLQLDEMQTFSSGTAYSRYSPA